MKDNIPDYILQRIPLIKPEWLETLKRMREHPDAPRWNIEIGDRLTLEDIEYVRTYAANLEKNRDCDSPYPPDRILEWIEQQLPHVLYFQERLKGLDIRKDFFAVPCMERRDLQQRIEKIVPFDMSLEGLIVNPTSGTTGQPIQAPNHPRAIGCYDPLIQFSLRSHGLRETYDHSKIAAIQVCFQKETIVYNTVHSYLDGAGFAKVNLEISNWPHHQSPSRYMAGMAPVFISGDPIAFMEMMAMGIDYQPRALLSTALSLSPALREKLQETYRCPVINFYSLNETGPIAYSCPEEPDFFQVLPNDLLVEVLDEKGFPVPDGEPGEICVTGGRNPFIPLLRYRTGDRGVLFRRSARGALFEKSPWHGHPPNEKMFSPAQMVPTFQPTLGGSPRRGALDPRQKLSSDGLTEKFDMIYDPAPRLKLLDGRLPVLLDTPSGKRVNPIDLHRILRHYPISRHRYLQNQDKSITLFLEGPGAEWFEADIVKEVSALFENEIPVQVKVDLF